MKRERLVAAPPSVDGSGQALGLHAQMAGPYLRPNTASH